MFRSVDMVTNITSLTGNGLKDWLIQRLSGVYFLLYLAYLAFFFARHPQLTYADWSQLFQCKLFQIATILALVALTLHAWIGLWTVTTDYIKCTILRLSTQSLILLVLLSQLLGGMMIIWGR
jgi:succinate dehydrogenase / fumarate reductase, membrane anchor subunit